ncbi:hypothetical protein EE612_017930 [Oryza sativa]|nr:hypothetical protein EE612_017930 [Oryza sativa]
MMPTPTTIICLLAFLAVLAAATGDGTTTTTHLHFYIHETFAGDNATTASLAPSPLAVAGSNSSFGSVGALDDELREGSDAASRYLGRVEGLVVQADLGNPAAAWTLLTLAFAGGDYNGSTLVLDGRVDFGAAGDMERAVVGGTGRFRRARGYSLMTKFGNPTPNTDVFEMDVYVTTMA